MWYDLSLSWRNITTRKVQTLITVLVVSLAIGLFVTISVLGDGIRQGIIQASDPFGVLVVGPKGNGQQLVLSTLLLQGIPAGTFPEEALHELENDDRVDTIVPIAMGDNIGGARVIGTSSDFFELRSDPGAPPTFQLVDGRLFADDFEAVLGAGAAAELGLNIGDTFVPSHGVERGFEPDEHGEAVHVVVGILGSSNSPYDRAVFTNLDSVWNIHDDHLGEIAQLADDDHSDEAHADEHESEGHHDEGENHEGEEHHDEGENHEGEEHHDDKDHHDEEEHDHAAHGGDGDIATGLLTAALIKPVNFAVTSSLWQDVNDTTTAQAVYPGQELGGLFDQMRQGERVLTAVGYLAAGMAALTVLLAVYSATAAREQSIAIMRSLGASRASVLRIVIFEAIIVTLLGALVGRLIGYLFASLVASGLAAQSAVPVPIRFLPELEPFLWLLPLGLGVLAGLYPALLAYRVNIVEKLFPN